MRADFLHHIVDIISVDGDELSLGDRRKGLVRHPREVGHDANHEGKVSLLNGAACLHIIGNVYPWRSNPTDFLLQAFFRHSLLLLSEGAASFGRQLSPNFQSRASHASLRKNIMT